MVTATAGPDGPGRRDPATTLSGWRQFVDTDPAVFALLPGEQLAALSGQRRAAYDEARLDYHSELVVVTTSAVRQVIGQGSLLTVLNRRETGARRGLIVSGDGTTGKTTAIKQFGRAYELRMRARYP
ncbi:MAG TPA: ATP/GTP-binding protein, partial [Streptosporangiaceae bacterium]|nr:ATP/GTP-binding protein [Streptosporangiaceae bacterium]